MTTEATSRSGVLARTDSPARIGRPDARPIDRPQASPGIDLVEALSELQAETTGLQSNGLADALLNWLAPAPPQPGTLAQSRIVPLLGAAADLLSRGAVLAPEIKDLGAAALEQELRLQRALADRRASLLAAGPST